jgi:hypothetical protein
MDSYCGGKALLICRIGATPEVLIEVCVSTVESFTHPRIVASNHW